jgi:hypothetical protein
MPPTLTRMNSQRLPAALAGCSGVTGIVDVGGRFASSSSGSHPPHAAIRNSRTRRT